MKYSIPALAFAGTTTAAPALLQRQTYSETWNDPYIPEPINFQLRNAGAQCDFQLVYERFSVDNRYDIDYIGEYADGSQVKLNPISGTLARDNVWLVDGLDEARALQVVFFPDICESGSGPTSFRVNANLRDGFTYENNWTSGSLPLAAGELPDVPTNVQLQSSEKSSTVTWSAVRDASGYVVFVRWLVDSELGPDTIPFVWARELGPEATSFTYDRDFTHASVVAVGDARSFTALGVVQDVRPS